MFIDRGAGPLRTALVGFGLRAINISPLTG
jgi:hypothetical protein